MAKRKAAQGQKWYTEQDSHGASSKFGQMIGDAFAAVVIRLIEDYLTAHYPDFVLLEPEEGRAVIRLEMFGGTLRQLDNVIVPKNSPDPIALFESKWLKDARHHNDKGAWILQLKEIRKKYPTVRGAAALLAGYWTEGVGVMFRSEGGVQTVLVATDDEVYGTLQEPLDRFLNQHNLPELSLNAETIRVSLPRPHDLANFLNECRLNGELAPIAASWLDFVRGEASEGIILGRQLIQSAIDDLLTPLPDTPQVKRFEISLQIDTGNTIYGEFSDAEEAMQFIQMYLSDPQAILAKITPRKRP